MTNGRPKLVAAVGSSDYHPAACVDPDQGGGSRGTVTRRGAALECLDDDHATAAAGTRVREWLGIVGLGAAVIRDLGVGRWRVEQAARSGDVVAAGAAGEQAVVTDAVEALRQDVDQESADELVGGECHDLLAITTFGAIILPSEGDAGTAVGDQPAVGDGDTVGIARQIGQHGLWAAERTLGIDHPVRRSGAR
jgi:hypothetical protein